MRIFSPTVYVLAVLFFYIPRHSDIVSQKVFGISVLLDVGDSGAVGISSLAMSMSKCL